MSAEPAVARCVILRETDNALHIQQSIEGRAPLNPVWIPRSQLDHISKKGRNKQGLMDATIEMPEWLADKKGLIYQ